MGTASAVEYHVFADFAGALALPPIGTTDEYRGGAWYTARLREPVDLRATFDDGSGNTRSSDVDIIIADGPDGVYRAAAIAGAFNTTAVVITQVLRETPPNGAPVEVVQVQRLTVTATRVSPTTITLTLADIEEKRLDALYPSALWSADDWPGLADTDAGKPICYPVGTALKLPCPQVVADDAGSAYWFGVCGGTPRLFSITSINSGAKQVTISGAGLIDVLAVGQIVHIVGSSAADNRYTVASIVSPTVFTVAETLPASSGGSVRLMPHILTVYRNGRIVDPSEYTVQHLYGHPPLTNGDFETGDFTGWSVFTSGTGTATVVAKQAVLTAASITNVAWIEQSLTVAKGLLLQASLDNAASSTTNAQFVTNGGILIAPGTRGYLLATASGAAINLRTYPQNYNGTITVDNVRVVSTDLVLIKFTRPQVDFNGSAYRIEADVFGPDSRNGADEVARLLGMAGVTVDAASFNAARINSGGKNMYVDCDYGRAGQRAIRAILDDHLYLLRGSLQRNAAGEYAIVQDLGAGSVVYTGDESLGDSLQVDGAQWPARPTSVGIRYRPGAADPNVLQTTITRAVVGGSLGDEQPRDMPYLRDHAVADQLLCYRALRAQYNAVCDATIYRQQLNVGDVVTLGSPLNWGASARSWQVRSLVRQPRSNRLSLLEYSAAVYTYTPSSPLPVSASSITYQPDYSQTPPAAPTALIINSGAVAIGTDGTSTAWVKVTCTPPAVNWSEIWFVATHNVTGEMTLCKGTDNLFGGYTATLTGLRPGNVYKLGCYAVNAFNLQGAILATFNASAIGGGNPVTTFTTPGYATAPPNVPAISAAQGTGLTVQVIWTRVTMSADILGDYILERKINAGAFAEVWRGRANSYTDRDFFAYGYGVSVQYRVRASDRWGNVSAAYATSSALTLQRNIYGGTGAGADIRDGTVQTVNRTGVTTISAAWNSPSPQQNLSISHALGIVPIVSYDIFGKTGYWVGIGSVTTSSVAANINRHRPWGAGAITTTNNNVAGDPHTHNIDQTWLGDAGTVRFYLW